MVLSEHCSNSRRPVDNSTEPEHSTCAGHCGSASCLTARSSTAGSRQCTTSSPTPWRSSHSYPSASSRSVVPWTSLVRQTLFGHWRIYCYLFHRECLNMNLFPVAFYCFIRLVSQTFQKCIVIQSPCTSA